MSAQAVYVMSVPSGYRKIGIAADPNARRMSLQSACPEPITLEYTASFVSKRVSAANLEKELHRKFAKCRTRGEWFQISLEEIEAALSDAWEYLIRKKPAAVMMSSASATVNFGLEGEESIFSRRPGRPLIGDQHNSLRALQPWKAAGMSRAAWYARKKGK